MVGRRKRELGLEGIEVILRTGAANYSVTTMGEFKSQGSSESFSDSSYQHDSSSSSSPLSLFAFCPTPVPTMASRFVVSNPALAPLFAAVGAGMVGASWFGFHTLKNNQEVLIARGNNPTPWNNVRQDQNTKLYSPNTEWWKSRAGLPDPRSAFAATTDAVMRAELKVQDVAMKASDKVHEVKDRALGRH